MASYVEHGIHLLVSQHGDGSITIGDSHEYGEHFRPYTDLAVDELILEYLDTFLPTEDFTVIQRWDGVYGKLSGKTHLFVEPMPGVAVVAGVGGAGMTMSFGVGEKSIRKLLS